jgi:hypothetical protein
MKVKFINYEAMANKKLILRIPEVLESFGPGAIQILDFRFRILDLKTIAAIEP